MGDREYNSPLNTETLQKTYPEVYRDFFSSCDFVFSAPATFSWCGDVATRFGGLGCAQKIPRRLYLGLARLPGLKSGERTITCFERNAWLTAQLSENIDGVSQLVSYLQNKFPNKFKDYHITVLSEFPFSIGLSGSAAVGAASAYALATFANPKSRLTQAPLDFLLSDPVINELIRDAWKLRCITGGEGTSGYTEVVTALFPGGHPFVVASQYNEDDLSKNFHQNPSFANLEPGANVPLFAHRLDKLFKFNPHLKQRPFDIAVITLGPPSEGDHRFQPLADQRALFSRISSKEFLTQVCSPSDIEQLYKFLFSGEKLDLWKYHIVFLNATSIRVITALAQVFHNPKSIPLHALTQALTHYHNALSLLNATNPQVEAFLGMLRSFFVKHPMPESYGAKTNGGSYTSSILLTSGARSLQRVLVPLLHEARVSGFPDIELEWASWRDGFESDGTRIEHAPSLGVVHKLTEDASLKGGYAITIYHGDGTNASKALKRLDPAVADLFLDEVREKVWCGGKPVSAEELPSQRMAIMLLKQLATTPDSRVANTDLPRSSYTSYRNELQSKIIGPLRKLVDKRLRKELALNIEGSLTKFHIVRGKDDVAIAIRKK